MQTIAFTRDHQAQIWRVFYARCSGEDKMRTNDGNAFVPRPFEVAMVRGALQQSAAFLWRYVVSPAAWKLALTA